MHFFQGLFLENFPQLVFHRRITAQGGAEGGNGGFVETSGYHYLDVDNAYVNLLAAKGSAGTWLLDPTDLTISTGSNSNVNTSGSTFTGDANQTTSVLNVTTLTNALALANVIVQTGGGGTGGGSGNITVANTISWSAATSLTLSAYGNIILNANITNTSGSAISVNLRADNAARTQATGTIFGTVSGSGVVTTAASGSINIYYNPSDYTSPTSFTANASGGTLTAYMLVNVLGNASDATTQRSLSALGLNANSALWNKNYALGTDINASATSTWYTNAGMRPIVRLLIV